MFESALEVPVDLSFRRLEPAQPGMVLPVSFAVLMVGVAARQAASATARLAMRIDRTGRRESIFFPARGPFNAAMAATLSSWKEE